MSQTRDYVTKKKGKTEVQPFWNMSDIKNVVEWFEKMMNGMDILLHY